VIALAENIHLCPGFWLSIESDEIRPAHARYKSASMVLLPLSVPEVHVCCGNYFGSGYQLKLYILDWSYWR